MLDYNVLTYAVKEVGEETNIPRCVSRVKSVYSHIKEKQIEAKEHRVKAEKTLSVTEITQGVKSDMNDSERPIMGDITESEVSDQNYFEK